MKVAISEQIAEMDGEGEGQRQKPQSPVLMEAPVDVTAVKGCGAVPLGRPDWRGRTTIGPEWLAH